MIPVSLAESADPDGGGEGAGGGGGGTAPHPAGDAPGGEREQGVQWRFIEYHVGFIHLMACHHVQNEPMFRGLKPGIGGYKGLRPVNL